MSVLGLRTDLWAHVLLWLKRVSRSGTQCACTTTQGGRHWKGKLIWDYSFRLLAWVSSRHFFSVISASLVPPSAGRVVNQLALSLR